MWREIAISLASNFVFSLCLFTYKRNYHFHYDQIIIRLNRIEEKMIKNDIPIHTQYFYKEK